MAGYTTSGRKEIAALHRSRLAGLYSEMVLFVEVGGGAQEAESELSRLSFNYRDFLAISPIERAAIVREVCGSNFGIGKRDERISNGVFAIVIALWAEARQVEIAGFSLDGGYSYATKVERRNHLIGDIACLKRLLANPKVTASNNEFATAVRDAPIFT
jgi:hypothetical protein